LFKAVLDVMLFFAVSDPVIMPTTKLELAELFGDMLFPEEPFMT
jgi:hypothetical protein